jgi:hypothetical protein
MSTRIDKPTADRPHFCIAYGTRAPSGLKAFREVEATALRGHHKLRAKAKQSKRESRTKQTELFTSDSVPELSFEQIVTENCKSAKQWIVALLNERKTHIEFGDLVLEVLETFTLRETNVKNICVQLADAGLIENTWNADKKKKPHDRCLIVLGTP